MVNEDFPDQPGILQWFTGFEPTLFISDPEMVDQLYVAKNKYFDKHPRLADVFRPLLGDSTLMMRNNEEWAKRRNTLSMTFYKDKLTKYYNLIKDCQLEHL